MASAAALVELGDRYAALGLTAAARAAFERALAGAGDDDPAPARRLAELAPAAGALTKVRALCGRAQVALAEADRPGAVATCLAALDELDRYAAAAGRRPEELEAELALADDALVLAVAAGAGDEILTRLDGSAAPPWWRTLLGALALAHGQAQGERPVDEGAVERALEAALALRPESRPIRLQLAEWRLRRRRDDTARARALAELDALAGEVKDAPVGPLESVDLARVYFLLGSAWADDPARLDRAERAYREGLRLRPGHAGAANQLALLALARGDVMTALGDIELALRIDSGHGLAWRSAARVLEAVSPGAALPGLVERILDAAWPGAGSAAGPVAPRLVTAMAEVTRGDVLAGIYTRGHRLKNLLGIAAARARSARKASAAGDVSERLGELERELTALYDEWAAYLRSMQAAGPRLEILP